MYLCIYFYSLYVVVIEMDGLEGKMERLVEHMSHQAANTIKFQNDARANMDLLHADNVSLSNTVVKLACTIGRRDSQIAKLNERLNVVLEELHKAEGRLAVYEEEITTEDNEAFEKDAKENPPEPGTFWDATLDGKGEFVFKKREEPDVTYQYTDEKEEKHTVSVTSVGPVHGHMDLRDPKNLLWLLQTGLLQRKDDA